MLNSELDIGNKLSSQTPSSEQWMGTRHTEPPEEGFHLQGYISDASSYNCCYDDYGIHLHLMNRQNFCLVFGARTGSTLVSMKSKHYSQGGTGYQQIRV